MPKLCADPSVPYFPTPLAVGANAPDEPCVLQPFQPRAYRFFATAWRSASCDTVEPGSCSNRRKNSCPRSVTSKDPIFLLGNPILLASRAALLFSPPPAPDQTCQKGIALRAHPFSPIVRGTCFFCWSAHPAPGLFSDLLQGHFQGTLRTLPGLATSPGQENVSWSKNGRNTRPGSNLCSVPVSANFCACSPMTRSLSSPLSGLCRTGHPSCLRQP